MTDNSLALRGFPPDLPADSEARRRLLKRAVSVILVGLVHLVMLVALISSLNLRQEQVRLGSLGPVETIIDFSKLRTRNAPPVNLIRPEVQTNAPPEVTTAPIVVPPPPRLPLSPPLTPGDVLKAVGEALACGASSFENLTQTERDRCRHQPWLARKLPNGDIVLQPAPKALAGAPPPVIHMTGAEALRHQLQTAPPCPILLNTPCVQTAPNLFDSNRGILPDQSGN